MLSGGGRFFACGDRVWLERPSPFLDGDGAWTALTPDHDEYSEYLLRRNSKTRPVRMIVFGEAGELSLGLAVHRQAAFFDRASGPHLGCLPHGDGELGRRGPLLAGLRRGCRKSHFRERTTSTPRRLSSMLALPGVTRWIPEKVAFGWRRRPWADCGSERKWCSATRLCFVGGSR